MKRNNKIRKGTAAFVFAGIAAGAAFLLLKSRKSTSPPIKMEEAINIVNENKPTEEVSTTVDTEYINEEDVEEIDEAYESYIRKNIAEIEAEYINEMKEKEEKLRKGIDPNSDEAYESYIRMKIADFEPESLESETITRLFYIGFVPVTQGDRGIFSALKEERASFFGHDSKWSKELAWADIFLRYADRVTYFLKDNTESWIGFMLDHLEITLSTYDDELSDILEQLEQHDYINDNTGLYGLFGLNDYGMECLNEQLIYQVEKIPSFETEFKAFLDMVTSTEEDEDDSIQ